MPTKEELREYGNVKAEIYGILTQWLGHWPAQEAYNSIQKIIEPKYLGETQNGKS